MIDLLDKVSGWWRIEFFITSTVPSRSCGAGVKLFVLGMVLEDSHVREVYILYLQFLFI